MANLKDLIVNGVSRFLGKVYINDSQITTINGVTVGDSPKFTDTTALDSMTGTLGVDHGGTGQTSAKNAANAFMNALDTGSSTPTDNDYYISQYVGGGTTTTTYHRRPVSALWNYIKSKIDANGGYTNKNEFGNIKVGSTTIAADAIQDTLELVAGSNVTLTPDATNDKVTIAATDTTYESKAAASGGTAVSLVTTGEKYTWNSKTSNTGTITGVSANGTSVATSGVANIPAADTSKYGVTKLSDATNSTSTVLAATANAVRKAFDNGGVTSVNGNTGAVTVTVPTKVSDLTNDSGFEANQNAFSNIKIGNSTIAADAETDTLELAAGSNITLTPDTTNDKVTIAASIPMAGISTLGGIKVGSGLSIAADGTLSSTGGGGGSGGVTGMTITYSASDETIYITTTIPNGDEVSY